MLIKCISCSSSLKFDDEKLPGKKFAVNCPKCGERNIVDIADKGAGGDKIKIGSAQQHVHAIRMNWLGRLKDPLTALWDFIIDSILYTWDITRLAWKGMNASFRVSYWVIAAVGGITSIFLYSLSGYIARLTKLTFLPLIGMVLAILPLIWAFTIISNLIKKKSKFNEEIGIRDLKHELGIGFQAIIKIGLFVGIAVVAIGLQVGFNFAGKIPHAGPVVLSVISLPLLLASALAFVSIVILVLGLPFLGPHIVEDDQVDLSFFKNFINFSLSFIKLLAKRWIDIFLTAIPAFVFGIFVSIIPFALLYGSFYISGMIMGQVAGIGNANPVMGMMGIFTSTGVVGHISSFFMMITLSIVTGVTISFFLANYASIYYSLYTYKREISIFKKIFGVAFLLFIIFLITKWAGISISMKMLR